MDEIVSTTIHSSSRNRRATTFLLQFYCFALLQLTNVNASSTTRALFLWAMYNAFIFGCREKKTILIGVTREQIANCGCVDPKKFAQLHSYARYVMLIRFLFSYYVFFSCSLAVAQVLFSLSLSPLHSQLSYTQPLLLAIYYKLFSV